MDGSATMVCAYARGPQVGDYAGRTNSGSSQPALAGVRLRRRRRGTRHLYGRRHLRLSAVRRANPRAAEFAGLAESSSREVGSGDLWITEYTIIYQGRAAYTVSIMEFRDGKVVHETQYFADPFEAPAWRAQWVQQLT
jgi:hypothetical protein